MRALLKAWLKPNPLTEDPDDYNATISGMGSMDLDDIVDEIMKDGTENKRETIQSIVDLFQEKVMQLALTGHSVNTGMIYMRPIIRGAIYNKQWNPEHNSVYMSIKQGKKLSLAIAETKVEFYGVKSEPIEIYSITNMHSNAMEGSLTRGKNALVKGAFIKIAGEHPACGIILKNTFSLVEFKLPAQNIVLNEPSRLMLLIPDALEAGEYEMILITQFTKSSFLLKTPRTYTYQHPLQIS